MLMGMNYAPIYDELDVIFSGLLFDGSNHRLIFFGLSNAFDHFNEFGTLGKVKFFEVDGHLHFKSRKLSDHRQSWGDEDDPRTASVPPLLGPLTFYLN